MTSGTIVQVDDGKIVGLWPVESVELIHDVNPGEYLLTVNESGPRVVHMESGRVVQLDHGDDVLWTILNMK